MTFPSLANAKRICIDTETNDPAIAEGEGCGAQKGGYIAGIGIGTDDGFREYYPVAHAAGDNFDPKSVFRWLKTELSRPSQDKVFANAPYDLEYLAVAGVEVNGRILDVQIAEPLLDEHQWSYALDNLGKKYLGEGKNEDYLYQYLAGRFGGKPDRKSQAKNIWRAPGNIVRDYALGDIDLPLRILEKQLVELEKQELLDLFYLESDLIPMMLAMKLRGVKVDIKKAEEVAHDLSKRVALNQSILGPSVNVNASASLATVWDRNGLSYPLTEKTKKPSFTKETLAACTHPVARLVETIRKETKLRDTFVQKAIMEQHINGRIHATFNQLKSDDKGTVSGRFSCSAPNLQQVPSKGEGTELIRQIFVPDSQDETWYSIDYSQIEYRIFAHYSEDEDLIEAYRDPNTDFHDTVSGILNNTLERKVVKCVAEGQLVLTDKGLVPIENVTVAHRIWDGVQWATHDGIVFTGYKEVINYAGLTATPDHRVFTEDGRLITLETAKLSGSKLARTEVQGEARSFTKIRASTRLKEKMSGLLRTVRKGILASDRQSVTRARRTMRVLEKRTPAQIRRGNPIRGAIQHYSVQMRTSFKSKLQELRGTRDQTQVQFETALYNILCPDVWASLQCEGSGVGQGGQRRSLRTWESSLHNKSTKPEKHPSKQAKYLERKNLSMQSGSIRRNPPSVSGVGDLERKVDASSCGRELVRDGHNQLSTKRERTGELGSIQRTFGIQNAGPNFRFTVGGVLTKNTVNFLSLYGGGYVKLAGSLRVNMSVSEVEAMYDKLDDIQDPMKFNWRVKYEQKKNPLYKPDIYDIAAYRVLEVYAERFPAAKQLAEDVGQVAKKRGYIRTLLNRRRRFVNESTHKALNALCQGSAADIMKKSMVDIWKSGICDVLGAPLLTVHDELNFSVPKTKIGVEAVTEARRLMETTVKLKVPITCDCESGPDWGHVE